MDKSVALAISAVAGVLGHLMVANIVNNVRETGYGPESEFQSFILWLSEYDLPLFVSIALVVAVILLWFEVRRLEGRLAAAMIPASSIDKLK